MDSVNTTPEDRELKAYSYVLPPELVAERPVPGRVGSRLLAHDIPTDTTAHGLFKELGAFLPPQSTLVLNRSKVFPCRLVGQKTSGGEAEAFILSLTPREGLYQVLLRASGKRKLGEKLLFPRLTLDLVEYGEEGTFWVRPNVAHLDFLRLLNQHAGIPIPPYIRDGIADEQDRTDYQTVYAQDEGSVAAPTAGLHFTPEFLKSLEEMGHTIAYVTLHVGLGTFKPVKSADITEHRMHSESFMVDPSEAEKIRQGQGHLVAVGTTSLRVLESSFTGHDFDFPALNETRQTRIFLHPGIPVRSISGLVTNFHLPQSSLLMLVSALAGRRRVLRLYEEAVRERYRFFSYGDAMFLQK